MRRARRAPAASSGLGICALLGALVAAASPSTPSPEVLAPAEVCQRFSALVDSLDSRSASVVADGDHLLMTDTPTRPVVPDDKDWVEDKLLLNYLDFVWRYDAAPGRHRLVSSPWPPPPGAEQEQRKRFRGLVTGVYERAGGLFVVDVDLNGDGKTERVVYSAYCGLCQMQAPVVATVDDRIDTALTFKYLRRPLGLPLPRRGRYVDLWIDPLFRMARIGGHDFVSFSWGLVAAPPEHKVGPHELYVYRVGTPRPHHVCSLPPRAAQ